MLEHEYLHCPQNEFHSEMDHLTYFFLKSLLVSTLEVTDIRLSVATLHFTILHCRVTTERVLKKRGWWGLVQSKRHYPLLQAAAQESPAEDGGTEPN